MADIDFSDLIPAKPQQPQQPQTAQAPQIDFSDLVPAGKARAAVDFGDLVPEKRQAGDASAAIGRGLVDGVPVVGPYLLGGLNRVAAGVRALKNDSRYSDELKAVEDFGQQTAAEHPIATGAGEVAGGVLGTAPLVIAAPAVFGASGAALPARMVASGVSGGILGGADSAVRSGGDTGAIQFGAGLGAGLGAAGPAAGRLAGKVVSAVTGGGRGQGVVGEALEGLDEKDLEAAQHLIRQAQDLPGGGVPLSLDEALNAATGGRAVRASQLARVVANSGGEGGRVMNEFYAARPAAIDNVGRETFERLAPMPEAPSALGPPIQDAARAGIAQTPEGMAFSAARSATGPRVTPEQAGQTIQGELSGIRGGLEAARKTASDPLYEVARNAPERAGIERMITVERPGDPIVTPQAYSRPQFTGDAPRPLEAFVRPDAEAAAAGPESLGRFIARNGGLRLDGDVAATDLHRFNVPGLGNVARQNGKGIDDFWRERLIEEGYFRPDADGGMARDISSELLRKLQNEQRGFPSYPLGTTRGGGGAPTAGHLADDYSQAVSLANSRLREDLGKVGIDADTLHPDVRDRVVGSLVRGQHADPLDAYEAVVNAMREQPAPLVKSTTIQEQIPDVRFGQVNPQPAIAAIDDLLQTAKGDVRSGLQAARRNLFEGANPDGAVDMTVAGNLRARERLDQDVRSAIEIGDGTKVRDLTIARQGIDRGLKEVPEVAAADEVFARHSLPLEPYSRPNAPLGRATDRLETPGGDGPFRMPAEQVPGTFTGATAARELLAQPAPLSREALERHVTTQIMDRAAGADGSLSVDALRGAMREHADVLDQLPGVRDRLSNVVVSREGLARVEASPLGQLAAAPDVGKAVRTLFNPNPAPGSHTEVAAAMQALAAARPQQARELSRTYLETVFNEATQQTKGLASQYGGAGFASAIRGNAQQRHNLEAVIRALPDGETRWTALDKLLTTLEATGYRPTKGSDTAFNTAIQDRLKNGTPVAAAISDAATGALAGATAAGPAGAAAGGLVGFRKAASHALGERSRDLNGAAIARIFTDTQAVPDLRALAKSAPGSKNAEVFTHRLLGLANPALVPTREHRAN
ncbi:hypothetical protein [Methylobacterium sp. OT2]|uniref:hypothetical protein n=1 Tax=Methylobacterium sp. OT2 TaxID=2813779 RepID=UPI00197B7341|nr:hypothetical protein [Methylobacterium sp. OT2]MBN4095652.1 hypothetical protein [Methylobacterium sp. OT2]